MTHPPVPSARKRAKANRMNFTDAKVKALKPNKAKQYLKWDEGTGAARGLAILVSPTGTKSYRCVYYYPGSSKPHYMHLGRVGELSLEDARKHALGVRKKASEGIPPNAEDPKKSDAFAEAVDLYIRHEQVGRRNNKSAEKTKNVLLNNCKDWHPRPIATIRSDEIEKLLWVVRDGDSDKGMKRRPHLSNRLFSHLKDFFGWCAARYSIKASPMANMQQPWLGAKPRQRDWFKGTAADDAIRALWDCADKIGGVDGRYLKLMILTGKRRTALANMRWEQIDDSWYWDAPPSEVKNKRLHGVPLPAYAKQVLHPRQKQGKVFDKLSGLDRLAERVRELSGIQNFIWHGLRHLAETKMAELRDEQKRSLILPHIRDLLLDHESKRGAGKGYDHHDYIPEMGAAMKVWGEYVERVVQLQEGVRRLR